MTALDAERLAQGVRNEKGNSTFYYFSIHQFAFLHVCQLALFFYVNLILPSYYIDTSFTTLKWQV